MRPLGLTRAAEDLHTALVSFTLPVMMGFHSLIGGGVLDRFPR